MTFRRWFGKWWSLIVWLILFGLVILTLLAGCSSGAPAAKIKVAASSAPAAEPDDLSLTVTDVEIEFRVKKKQCFGDAGCNLVVRPEIHLFKDPGDDQTYEITFRVSGDTSGPVTDSVTLTGTQVSFTDLDLSTSGPTVKITGKVTDVERWPY